MTAYALARLQRPAEPVHPEVLDYLREIDGTLEPFGGRFLVHGAPVDVREGDWQGDVVLIAFPDLASARAWYGSPAYVAIRRWRTDHIAGDAVLVDGVGPGHRATDLTAALSAPADPGRPPR
ncbi:DUF1330 domain-containing protein [Vallicoccus soli]|uniref:DUF1330 domain-containing protein n=1 Tax=Vallicoccus soli TaxID=2339232 RepID=A0A3A3YNJ8_9ACTN|nr:DUF1330 domain-containing protein [Vallicoccus soli]RJK92971.1 DUF1330 domain-containing protein [Vallicoccus soli]